MPNLYLYRAKILNPLENGEINYIPDGYLLIDNYGSILDCGDYSNFDPDLTYFNLIDYSDYLIIPGMIDTHTHFPQYDIIGVGSGELLDWLNHFVFPLESKFNDFEFSYIKSKIFFEELVRNGTTTAFIYSSIHLNSTMAAFEAAISIGINAFIGNSMSDSKNYDGTKYTARENILIAEQVMNKYHKNTTNNVEYIVTPRYAGNCSFELLKSAANYAKSNGLYIQTHLSENQIELQLIKERFPEFNNYTSIYNKAGLLGEKTILAHCIYLDDSEINLIKDSGSIIAHCPTSNRYLMSGIMPLDKYINNKMKVTIGTDIAGGSNKSIIAESREARESSKTYKLLINNNCNILSPENAFRITNIDAAIHLGINSKYGNFDKHKRADFLVIENKDIDFSDKINNIISKLIYTTYQSNIKHTYISGKKIN